MPRSRKRRSRVISSSTHWVSNPPSDGQLRGDIHGATTSTTNTSASGWKHPCVGTSGTVEPSSGKDIHMSQRNLELREPGPFIQRRVSTNARKTGWESDDMGIKSTLEHVQGPPREILPAKLLSNGGLDEQNKDHCSKKNELDVLQRQRHDNTSETLQKFTDSGKRKETEIGEERREKLGRHWKDLDISGKCSDYHDIKPAYTSPQRMTTFESEDGLLDAKLDAARKIDALDEIHARQLREELSEAQDARSTLNQELQMSLSNNEKALVREATEKSRVANLEVALDKHHILLAEEKVVVDDKTNAKMRLAAERKAMKAELQRLRASEIKLQRRLAVHRIDPRSIEYMIDQQHQKSDRGCQKPRTESKRYEGRTLEHQMLETEVNDPSVVRALMQLFLQFEAEPKTLGTSEV